MKLLPWDNDIEPNFTNDEGWEWYIDKDRTRYVQKDEIKNGNKGLKDVYVFYVRKEDEWNWIVIDNKQNILAVEYGLDGLGHKLDILKAAATFNKVENDKE